MSKPIKVVFVVVVVVVENDVAVVDPRNLHFCITILVALFCWGISRKLPEGSGNTRMHFFPKKCWVQIFRTAKIKAKKNLSSKEVIVKNKVSQKNLE